MHPLLTGFLDVFFPAACLGCGGPIAAGDPAYPVCGRCRTRLRPLPPPLCVRCGGPLLRTGLRPSGDCSLCRDWPSELVRARSAFLLRPPADRLVHRLKYGGWRTLAAPMAALMAERVLGVEGREETDAVIPVPTTRGRRRSRGYNQAELLARGLCRVAGLPLLPALLRRGRGGSQTSLQPAARRANVAGNFRVARHTESSLRGARSLLVDDVLTTGATAGECARILTAGGARSVSVVTFARALDARRLTTI